MAKYTVVYACQYNGRIYRPDARNEDSILIYNKEVVPCPDCKGIKDEKKVCKLCKDSGRIDPPHHFKLIGEKVHAKEEEKGKEVLTEKPNAAKLNIDAETVLSDKEEIKGIRTEIIRLGGSYANRWDFNRLKQELLVTQKKYGEMNVVPPIPGV